jgi:sugar phosphate isomerase/epimerase
VSSVDLRLGVSLYSYTSEYGVTMTLDDCIEDISEMGATGLEILGEAHVENYPHPSAQWIDAYFARNERLGLTPTCLGSWIDTRRFPGRAMTVDGATAQLETDLRLASQLGFRYLRPKLGVVTFDLEPDPVWLPSTERVLDLAAELDIVICPEIHWPSTIKSKVVDDYIALIERTGTEHVGLLIDTGVFHKSMHHRQGGVASRLGDGDARPPLTPVVPVSDLEDVMPYVVHVQAKFYEIDDDLNDHHIPWEEFLGVLVRHEWSGWLSSEYEGDYRVGRASDQLRRQHALIRLALQKLGVQEVVSS